MTKGDVHECSEAEWQEHVREARLRVLFDQNPHVRAARKTYKQARVRGIPEREAWVAANTVYARVLKTLRARLAKETF